MVSNIVLPKCLPQPHVVILGGAYAGLSTALNLVRLCQGTFGQFSAKSGRGKGGMRGGREGGGGGGGGGRGVGRRGEMLREAFNQLQIPKVMPKITIIDPRDGFYHAVGTPMAHTSEEYINKPWITFDRIQELKHEDVSIVKGTALQVDPQTKTLLYTTGSPEAIAIGYDYLVVATGLQRPWPTVPKATTKSQYLRDARAYIDTVKSSKSVLVIGGGAVGIEMAAEIKHRYPLKEVTLVHSRSALLSSEPLSPEFRDQVLRVVRDGQVKVILDNRVADVTNGTESTKRVTLQDGREITVDEVIWATSISAPVTGFLPHHVLDAKGFVKTLPTTQFERLIPNWDCHFAIGDVAATTGIRLAAGAIRSGRVTAMNVAQMIAASMGSVEQQQQSINLVETAGAKNSIKIVIGSSGAAYSGEKGGMSWGPEVKEGVFGDDMALHRALGALGLPQHA